MFYLKVIILSVITQIEYPPPPKNNNNNNNNKKQN